jgi:hypothetical protein
LAAPLSSSDSTERRIVSRAIRENISIHFSPFFEFRKTLDMSGLYHILNLEIRPNIYNLFIGQHK